MPCPQSMPSKRCWKETPKQGAKAAEPQPLREEARRPNSTLAKTQFGLKRAAPLRLRVLTVVDRLEPLVGGVLAGRLKGDVAEPRVARGAMPVLDAGGNHHDSAGRKLLRVLSPL